MKNDDILLNKYYRNPNDVLSLWERKNDFAEVLLLALDVDISDEHKTELHYYAEYIISYTSVFLIKDLEDIRDISQYLMTEDKAPLFMKYFCMNTLVSDEVVFSLLNDENLIKEIGGYNDWIEYPLILRARKFISSLDSVNVEDLIPINIDIGNGLKEFLLSWAYEENKLSPRGIEYFRDNFNRKYNLLCSISNEDK